MNENDKNPFYIETAKRPSTFSIKTLLIVLVVMLTSALLLSFYYASLERPPVSFPLGEEFVIADGSSIATVVDRLKDEGYIRSKLYGHIVLRTSFEDKPILAGIYSFPSPQTTSEIMESIVTGLNKSPSISITIPEGLRGTQIEAIVSGLVSEEQNDATEKDYDAHIGYLFPDTYFVSRDESATELITRMRETFDERLQPLMQRVEASDMTLDEIVILASIIEREAKSPESMRMVAGILLERLRINMPLQVDATLDYLLDKESSELTLDDLALDSPYNTYVYRGLPPTPIANPGLVAIEAVLDPTPSDYLYYLTAPDGTFHYARTFEEHVRNKERYLR